MDFTIFLNVISRDLSNFLSVSRQKDICEVKKHSHVDIDAYYFERGLQQQKSKLTAALIAFYNVIKQLVHASAVRMSRY